MINEIRDYFRAVVSDVDSDLVEHQDPFTIDNIPNTVIDNSYHVSINDLSSTRIDTDYRDVFNVTVTTFKKGFNDPQNAYDEGYCKAIQIKYVGSNGLLTFVREYIIEVIGSSIVPRPIQSDDNSFIYEIQFQVTIAYS